MRDFDGKSAFVTGGASGIGLAMARAFAEAGMKVMLADVETAALEKALRGLSNYGNRVQGIRCDVADPESMERAAQAAFDSFGNVHVVCNNAGVAAGGGIDNISIDNWRWVVDVNLMGVLYGVRNFLPHMMKHREGGHIVNTASMAGMINGMGFSPYAATKFAVVAMSEGLAMQLQPHGIGVSVLCPEFVRTRIGESGRNRPERYGESPQLDPASPAEVKDGPARVEDGRICASAARRSAAGMDKLPQWLVVTSPVRASSSSTAMVSSTVAGVPPASGRLPERRSRRPAFSSASCRRCPGVRVSGSPSSAGTGRLSCREPWSTPRLPRR